MKKYFLAAMISVSWATNASSWEEWKSSFYQVGLDSGISRSLMDKFYNSVKPYEKAVSSDRTQAEFKKFLWDYLNSAVSPTRVKSGISKFSSNTTLLRNISSKYGVPAQYITAIWGMETSYGGYTGNVPIVNSMASLAYDGRRKDFFEAQLISILKLIDNGDIPSINIKGSWAGGMGHTQFIPTTYTDYAVDFNNDGKRNLWDKPDALASTANYLKEMGWKRNIPWGTEVYLGEKFNYLLANDKNNWKTLKQWSKLGVESIMGEKLANSNTKARVLAPAGFAGPQFLVYENFEIIKKYNNSDAYALGVSLLADKIAGKKGIQTPWPTNAKRLKKADIVLLQKKLNSLGFYSGKVDGIFGNGTRRALQIFQDSEGFIADGLLTNDLYNYLIVVPE